MRFLACRADGDVSTSALGSHDVCDSMRRIDDEIQNHLVEFAKEAGDLRKIRIQICHQFGDILVFIPCHT